MRNQAPFHHLGYALAINGSNGNEHRRCGRLIPIRRKVLRDRCWKSWSWWRRWWPWRSWWRRFRLGRLSGLKCRLVHRHLHVEGGPGFDGTTEAVATFYCEAARTFPSCFRLREPRGPRGRACPPPAQSRLGGTEAVAIQSGYQSAFSLSAAQNRLPSRQSGFLKQP